MNKLDAARFSEVISIINTTCDHVTLFTKSKRVGEARSNQAYGGQSWRDSVCTWTREGSTRKRKKGNEICLCFWLMIIYNMTSMNQDKYFRGFDICMYLFLFFSLIKIVMYLRCTSIKLLASNHLNVIYHGRDKLLWRTVSSQILDRWFPVLLWTILIRTIDRWR